MIQYLMFYTLSPMSVVFSFENILFAIVFGLQIYLISFYVPKKIYKRVLYVLDNFSNAEYPKLYLKSRE